MSTIQIAEITEAIAELGYDGTERYVVEIDGEYVGGGDRQTAESIADIAARRRVADRDWEIVKDDVSDYWGRTTWTLVEA